MTYALRYSAFILLFSGFYLVGDLRAAVLYEQSKIGVAYSLFQDAGAGFGFYSKFPQYSGTGPIFAGGGTSYSGTLAWLRVKRISGVGCHVPNNINISATDGNTLIGSVGTGIAIGDYCDFPISGPNLTNQAVGSIGICADGTCKGNPGTLVLDGSPANAGYMFEGTQTLPAEPGGWAFQLCDSGGCSGGFEKQPATSTPTSTPATGASSVLFLPGIMGSRLYEESSECADESGEQQRWFSTDDCEQLRLRTDFTGQSLNTLYTKPSESAVIDNIFSLSPLYGDFLERLADEKEKETIADYRAVPYDWRLRLEDVLKTREENGKIIFDQSISYQQSYLYKSLEELVATSKSGKVTIVAHSNGGLLAKALLVEMETQNDPLLDKVDNLILVAVPQVGTPDAVVSILHGAEIAKGFLIKGEVSRQIVNTAPFSHHLLPSEQYFSAEGSSVQTPVVTIEAGSVTDGWRSQFGSEITTHQDLIDFLSKDSGRIKPATDDLLNPEVVDNFLLDYADVAHSVQSAFAPPSTMKVSQVAGTGVGTPSSLTYFTDKECVSRSILSFFQCTEYRDKLGYRAVFASDGDGTVVLPSALAMSETSQVGRVWVDLDRYNDSRLISIVHRNILEVPDIQDFVFNTVESTTSRPYDYLSTTPIDPSEGDRLVFQLHSPLDMWVTTENGLVSSSTTEVSGALYERLGELQYIEIPAGENNIVLHLLGQKTGSFTLDIERWEGDSLTERVDYIAVPTATGTKVTAEIKSVLSTSVLGLDLEGNGTIDADMNPAGELIVKNVVSYPVLVTTIEQLSLKKSLKQVLITTIKSAEYYSNKKPALPLYLKLEDSLLTASADLIKLYAKKGHVSASDSDVLLGMIQVLKNKQ